MENFTPLTASLGGVLIGLAAVMLMATEGRIAGISGIAAGLFSGAGARTWRVFFVLGLISAPWVVVALHGARPPVVLDADYPLIVVGGLLVGVGTRLGGGCTSGHGVCGLARLSPRSLVAVAVFMAAGVAAVAILKALAGGVQ